ncbi:MAG: hypothetical protein ABI238_02590 [Terrimesophilobacter sp.]
MAELIRIGRVCCLEDGEVLPKFRGARGGGLDRLEDIPPPAELAEPFLLVSGVYGILYESVHYGPIV